MAVYHLDMSGAVCPLPVLKARKRLADLDPGDRLEIISTDPGSQADFQAFCSARKDAELISQTHEGEAFLHVLLKKPTPE